MCPKKIFFVSAPKFVYTKIKFYWKKMTSFISTLLNQALPKILGPKAQGKKVNEEAKHA